MTALRRLGAWLRARDPYFDEIASNVRDALQDARASFRRLAR